MRKMKLRLLQTKQRQKLKHLQKQKHLPMSKSRLRLKNLQKPKHLLMLKRQLQKSRKPHRPKHRREKKATRMVKNIF